MSEETAQGKINYNCLILFAKNKNAVGWSVQAVASQNTFEKLYSVVHFHMIFNHRVQHVVENCDQGA